MILVTGAAGLVGSFTVDELKRRGRDVRIFRRPEFDLSDPDSLVRAIQGTSGIVHAACTVTDTAVDIAAMETLLANWKVGPFVYISTLDVYGYVGSGTGTHLIEEDTPPGETMNEYSRAKVVCERLLIDAAARAGRRDYVILRAPYIWGPHPTARKRLVRARLEEGKPIVIPGSSRRNGCSTATPGSTCAISRGSSWNASRARPEVRSTCWPATSRGTISIPS